MVELARTSPLATRVDDLAGMATTTGGAVTLEEEPFLTQIDLRVAAEAAAGLGLPFEPNTSLEAGERSALWLGPDEWLCVGPPGNEATITTELRAALAGVHRSIVDVSANRAVLTVGGPARHELLATGCSIDLHPRNWSAGRCAQTLVAGVQVLLHERERSTRVLVRPSFAGFLVGRLLHASSGLLG